MAECPFCRTQISSVYYATTCPSCGKALHTCRCCRFFNPSAHYGCNENVDELVQDKDKPNFCDCFSLTEKTVAKSESSKDAVDRFNSFFNV